MAAGVKRKDLFVTSKLWRDDYNNVEGACRTSLRKLKLDYLDCYMIHWMLLPIDHEKKEWRVTSPPFHVIWQKMENLVKKGLVKSIAVSNCTIPMLINLLAGCKIRPVINQIELHPYLNQDAVVKYHKKWNIAVSGYAPIGGEGAPILSEPAINKIAAAKRKSPAQIVIAWHL